MKTLDSMVPSGPLPQKWERHRLTLKPVAPADRRTYRVIVVGTGLAGASAAATLAESGFSVECFCYQDSARRAHSIAAQGGINAAKNYPKDGDSVERLFADTIKGGDFRSREANVYRLAEVSNAIIDQCVAQGVPFAREYDGYLANRSFGGAKVSRTFYCRGQTGQQLLLGAYQSLMRQVHAGQAAVHARAEMLDLIVVDGRAQGIIVRDLVSGAVTPHAADAVILATGGYSTLFYLSTNAKGCNVTATYRAYKRGAYFANPCLTQIHPTCIPPHGGGQSKLTLMSESLRNDGRVWVPTQPRDMRPPRDIPQAERDYFLERKYPSYGNLAPRDISSRSAKEVCDAGHGVGPGGLGVYLDLSDAIARLGKPVIRERYGNLFQMYEQITGENAYDSPMRIYPAPHYTMGGLWVDYNLMSTIPGLFVIGEANFSDHGANRLGASALMQGLADGYFIVPFTVADYLAGVSPGHGRADARHSALAGVRRSCVADAPEFAEAAGGVEARVKRLLGVRGKKSADAFHRELGRLMWDACGMSRSAEGLTRALARIPALREEFWDDVNVPGEERDFNQALEHAGRVADFLEFAELVCRDALHREESCGGHFRVEHQTPDGEAKRDDERFCYVAAWEHQGEGKPPLLHKEPLVFEHIPLAQRSYK
ncbi:MAG: fumarate reductase/succinate dehydrogenase flavoprotein subunit [Candidatus Omnitrophica bacterium]|nr:fumarate reductase/succinate dehydrogenase flavoprotein subunit [Candidatus Omnitrophota bacterium]